MLWDMHLCVFDVRLSFENRVGKIWSQIPAKQSAAKLRMSILILY